MGSEMCIRDRPIGRPGIGLGIEWVLTRTQAREQFCTTCPNRLSRRSSRSTTSLQQGRSDRLSRRSSRSITSLQQGRSGRLGRAYGAHSHVNAQQPIPQGAASAVNNRTCGSIGCCIGCCLFQKKESLYFLNTQQPIQQPMPLEVLQIICLLYTSPSPRDGLLSRMPSSA